MRCPQLVIVLLAVLVKDLTPVRADLFGPLRNFAEGTTSKKNEAKGLPHLQEDEQYWARLLQDTNSLSISPFPSVSPSEPPSPSPSESPSEPPSPSPSASPSEPPSPSPSARPSEPPSPSPSASPSEPPSPSPSASPSEPPSPSPSASPSEPPSPSPSASPSEPPSPSPSASPSEPPSPSPSESPSEPPSPSPSAAPSITPPCMVELDVVCVSENGLICDEIFPPAEICQQRPMVLTMLYNGGPCGQSFNIQPSTLFQCFDLDEGDGAGPPPLTGPAYIEARSARSGELFFGGIVEAGMEFNITSANGVEPDTTIVIFSGMDNTSAPMQLINYHTSCSRNLFLKDRYGSTQVSGWINEEQGVVDCITTVIYSYSIENNGAVDAELCSLTATITPPGTTVDLTDEVAEQIVESGGTFEVMVPTEIDLTTRMTYTVEATLVGKNPVGSECTAMDNFTFDAGTPVFGLPSPPAPPTTSPAPTPVPGTVSCEIEASAECLLSNLAPCSSIPSLPPELYTCEASDVIDLGFIFTGGTCDASTTSQVFPCTDSDPSAPIESAARIRAVGTTTPGAPEYFNGLVTPDTAFAIQGVGNEPLDPIVNVTITDLSGAVLQTMLLNTTCTDENDWTLGETFGALRFGSYRNEEDFVSGFQDASWTYIVTNTGTIDVDITEFETITNGEVNSPESFPITLGPDEPFPFLVPTLLSLIEPGVTYTGSVDAAGIPGDCSAADSSSVTIV